MSGRRYVPGFRLLNEIKKKRTYPVKSGTLIAIGDLLKFTSGYVELATTLQQVTPILAGIAITENTAAQASADGAVNADVLPLLLEYDFIVPCEATGVLAQTDVGTLRDVESEDGLDEGDTVTAGLGFMIDEIDISSAALAASATFGFAIGHFETTFAS